jgi:acylphosphatase
MISRRYVITGRVQGVGFRYFVYEAAQQLGITGWVKNRFDGAVEIHAESPDSERLSTFLALINAGPPMSIVENVEARDVAGQDCARFRITR